MSSTSMRTLVWFRGKDLRISDHGPLCEAACHGEVIGLFVLDPYFFAPERARELPHRMQFLLESIAALQSNLEQLGSGLVLARGKSIEVVPRLARRWRVDKVLAQRWTEPFARKRDAIVAERLHVPFELHEGETLAVPEEVRTGEGKSYSVFTPFARAHRAVVRVGSPLRAPKTLPPLPDDIRADKATLPSLESLGIAHNPRLLAGGERAARERLRRFLASAAERYDAERDRLDLASTSRLSADLKFGTLSIRTVWTAARRALERTNPKAWRSFSNELLWREFTHAVLWNNPNLLKHPRRAEFETFPWEPNEPGWRAWCEGKTGYPIVDASARQLLGEGFVHNRARMISASFLVKDLLIDYRRGEAHYMKYLTDGDWAQNNAGWQWSAGCGFDAQPYFRVFNPIDQGRKFDPTGGYVRRWIPEIARLPDKHLHAPWEAPAAVLRAAGITLGETYPNPIVNHASARNRFLAIAQGRMSAR
ncbi:cryptochrome/photolyase family protein [Pendulispora albinea]|uniref:DNA photolyase family protein n=1 Tax=Pendulispora albinea TaxID=2741071 RepID=A0ABZ2M1L8_9BACT